MSSAPKAHRVSPEPKRHRCDQCRQMADCWRWIDSTDGKEYALCQRCTHAFIDAEIRKLRASTG